MKIKKTLSRLLKRVLAFFPSALPIGVPAFHKFADDIIEITALPDTVPADQQKFIIASSIMHLNSTECFKPKEYFRRTLRKAAAQLVASQVFQDIKMANEPKKDGPK